MKKLGYLLALPLILSACDPALDPASSEGGSENDVDMSEVTQIYSAELISSDGSDIGSVMISQGDGGNVSLAITDMKAGTYAMHLHQTGKCDMPDFKSAGGHWNPTDKEHGRENPQGAHAGDLPNLVVDADGGVKQVIDLPENTANNLSGLLDEDGAAFMLHERADDMKSDPAGDAGARIVCGVLKANEAG